MTRSRNALLGVLLALVAAPFGCERATDASSDQQAAEPEAPKPIICRAELRSFIVMGKGRHLYLLIDCPEGYDEYDGRVEYTTAAMRVDYIAPNDRSGAARVAKMSAGRPLLPIIENADDRFEAEFEITLEQAICLLQDRVFSERYALLGTNSSSGLRFTIEDCGCELPSRMLSSGGVFGDFPGINADPGRVIDRSLWPAFGIEGEEPILPPGDDFGPADRVG
jgi:hypothetical protein